MERAGSGPKRILIIGALHGDAGPMPTVASAMLDRVRTDGSPTATFYVIAQANPDGASAGRRENSHGVDLNRNFPSISYQSGGDHGEAALSEPEAAAVAKAVTLVDPQIVVVGLGTSGTPFVNYDGPRSAIGESVASVLGIRFAPSSALEATPGSIGKYLGVEQQRDVVFVGLTRTSDASSAAGAYAGPLVSLLEAG